MIKTALKHWIYEICINQLFDGIYKNFTVFQLEEYRIGKKFLTLRTFVGRDEDMELNFLDYYDGEIIGIEDPWIQIKSETMSEEFDMGEDVVGINKNVESAFVHIEDIELVKWKI